MHLPTGSRVLDSALAGGLPSGSGFLACSEEGAGATEFALALLKEVATGAHPRKAVFVSAIRSPERARREAELLLDDIKAASCITFERIGRRDALRDPRWLLDDLQEGDAIVVESADALANAADPTELVSFWQDLVDRAESRGVLAILLHAAATLPMAVEAALSERSDGVLYFVWKDSGPVRQRTLIVKKVRGLAPVMDADQVPVFEIGLHRGAGFSVSGTRSVL